MDPHGWMKETLFRRLLCVLTYNETDWGWLCFLSDHLGGKISLALLSSYGGNRGWLRSRMKNVRPGSLVVFSQHTDRWKRGTTTAAYSPVCGKRKRWLWGSGGSSQGSRVTLYQRTTATHREKAAHSQQRLGVWRGDYSPLCCYGNAIFVVFSPPSHTNRCEQIRACEVCSTIWAVAPLQLSDGSLCSEQPRFPHMTENTETCRYTHLPGLAKAQGCVIAPFD